MTQDGAMLSTDVADIPPSDAWDRNAARRALDELFTVAHQYNSSGSYLELIKFIGRFRSYSPFNAMLVHTQMPGARFVAPAHRWARQFRRQIKVGAHPLVILQPMGPVLFVFDVTDTEPLPGAPALPAWVERPFEVRGGKIGDELERTIENAKRDGVNISERAHGSQRAGSIQTTGSNGYLDVTVVTRPQTVIQRVKRRYELLLNSSLSREARYATLVHELGHLYCGHLGTPKPKWWPDRRGLPLEIREFEAESVCYLVCTRLGIENPSAEYLAAYVRDYDTTPPISLDAVLKSSWLIEQMGRDRLKLRTESKN
jgi:IrrE N-terminal-like domain